MVIWWLNKVILGYTVKTESSPEIVILSLYIFNEKRDFDVENGDF